MKIKYDIEIEDSTIDTMLKRIINQTYKLLPTREEGKEWQKLLQNLIEQLCGMKRLMVGQENLFFLIICKLEGLFSLKQEIDMKIYRRIIFQCLGLLNDLEKNVYN